MSTLKVCIYALLFTLSLSLFAGETKQISQQQLISLLNAPQSTPYIVLDVRSEEEFNQGHVPGAMNISHSDLSNKLKQLNAHKDNLVIVYCRSGRRAGIAEDILKENDFSNVKHLTGDMNGWVENARPIEK